MKGEFQGKTIEEALKAGLNELGGVSYDDVDVRILKHPGIFSKAVVEMTLIGEASDKLDKTTPEALMSKIQKRAATAEPAAFAKNPQKAKPQFDKKQPAPVQSNQPAPRPQPEKQAEKQPAPKPFEKQNVSAKPVEKAQQDRPQNRERVAAKPTAEELAAATAAAEKYLTNALKLMGIEGTLSTKSQGDEINIEILATDQQVIGYRGETLDALEYLTMLSACGESRIKVNLDSGGYREKRTAALVDLAKRLAEKAVRTGRKVDLEPMSSLNRKVIHSVLADNDAVITRSEGHEPNRYLVIIPKKQNGGDFHRNGNRNKNRNHNRNGGNNNNKKTEQ